MITPSRKVAPTSHTQPDSGDHVKYYLSTSQIKQLTASGRRMFIALPVPPSDNDAGFPVEWSPAEWTDWARNSLEQFGELIMFAKPVCVAVAFKQGKQGLEGFFGQICTEAAPIDRPVSLGRKNGKNSIQNELREQTGWTVGDTPGARQMLTVRTVVVLCHLIPDNCRKDPLPGDAGLFRIQWPGSAKRGEQRWPELRDDAADAKSLMKFAGIDPDAAGKPKPGSDSATSGDAEFWKRKARQLALALNCHRHASHEDTRDLVDLVLAATR